MICLFIASVTDLAGSNAMLSVWTASDAGHTPVKGVSLVLRHQASGLEKNVSTDGEGKYRFENLVDGTYELWAAADGLRPNQRASDRGRRRGSRA